jgi:hypothetical protein
MPYKTPELKFDVVAGNFLFLRTIVNYITYVSPVLNLQGSHVLRMHESHVSSEFSLFWIASE